MLPYTAPLDIQIPLVAWETYGWQSPLGRILKPLRLRIKDGLLHTCLVVLIIHPVEGGVPAKVDVAVLFLAHEREH